MEKTKVEIKKCLFCGKPIMTGRTDRLYCDDRCRNNHRYNTVGRNVGVMASINRRLVKNHRILLSCLKGNTEKTRATLLSKGFDFSLYTSHYTNHRGKQLTLVYDLAYSVDDKENVDVMKFLLE